MRLNVHAPYGAVEATGGKRTGMATKTEHTLVIEPLGNDRFALMIDGLARFVSYDADACRQRAEMILLSKKSTKETDDRALPSAIRHL